VDGGEGKRGGEGRKSGEGGEGKGKGKQGGGDLRHGFRAGMDAPDDDKVNTSRFCSAKLYACYKVRVLAIVLLKVRSALQFWKWQLTGNEHQLPFVNTKN